MPSPSAPEGAPGGDPFRSAIAERHVRISIRVLGVYVNEEGDEAMGVADLGLQ